MNNKNKKFLDGKLLELVDNNIISSEQYQNASKYFKSVTKEKLSITTIFTAIGILLMALSIITFFAFNWDNIDKGVKCVISFCPLIITAVMLYVSLAKEDDKFKLYTSIFAPVAIMATNSLLAQIFHIQTEIYELIFISLLMFLPIGFILRNYVSILVYGIGSIIYALFAVNNYSDNTALFNAIFIALPLVIYNSYNYVKDPKSKKNMIMWIINVILISMLLFFKEIFRPDVWLIYLYMVYTITNKLFERSGLNKLINLAFTIYLVISCTSSEMVSFAEYIEFGFDTLFISLVTLGFIYLSEMYNNPKEYFVLGFIILLQYTKMPEETLFFFVNLIALALGGYKIVTGNKEGSYKTIMQGVVIILLLILFRFMNSDLDFLSKSVMFLITGIIFVISANVMKKRMEEKSDE